MSLVIRYTLLVLVVFFAESANAAIIVGYDAADTTGGLTPLNGVDVSGTSLVRVGLNSPTGGSADFNSSNWTNSTTRYIEFGFTSLQTWNLTDLQFRGLRSSTGPSTLSVFASINGSAFSLVDTESVGTSVGNIVFDMSSLSGVTSATFQLRGLGTNSSGTLRISEGGNFASTTSDLLLSGSIAAVPEPGSVLFLSVAFSALLRYRWKQRFVADTFV